MQLENRIVICGIHETDYFGTPKNLQELGDAVAKRAVWVTPRLYGELKNTLFEVSPNPAEEFVMFITDRQLGLKKEQADGGMTIFTGEDVIKAAEENGLACGPHDLAFRLCLASQSNFPVLRNKLTIYTEPFWEKGKRERAMFRIEHDESIMSGPRDKLNCQVVGMPYFSMGTNTPGGEDGLYAFVKKKK